MAKKESFDVFKHLAFGFSTVEEGNIWEEEPVDIQTFIESRDFMNQKWDGKRGCRPKIMEIAKALTQDSVREAMLLLGKGCLAEGTVIWTKDGPKNIEDLSGKLVTVQSRDEDNLPFWNTGLCLPRGIQKVKRYTFGNGMRLEATDNHNINVPGKGVIKISDMEIGDYIAAPRKILKSNKSENNLSPYFCRMIGLLLGDGMFNKKRILLTCADKNIHNEFIKCVKEVDPQAVTNRYNIDTYILQTYDGSWERCKIYKMVEDLGLTGCKSLDKFIPDRIMNESYGNICELLSGLFSTDGWIEFKNCHSNRCLPGAFYCSRSRILLEQIKGLLLRLGICATLNWKMKKVKLESWDESRDIWGGALEISGKEDLVKFFDNIDCMRPNAKEAEDYVRGYTGLSMKPSDQIPLHFAKEAHLKSKGKTGVARYRFKRDVKNEYLSQLNIHWVKLTSVEDIGYRETYDIICEGNNHNYCANYLYPENSGKDYISSILHLYGIYLCLCMYSPQQYYGLSPGSPIYFVNTARNDKQAKKVFFAQFKAHLNNCPWFAGKHGPPGVDTVVFNKNIEALSANSQAFAWLGFNVIQWVGDELAFFLVNDSDDESDSRAEDCWEAAFGSCKTRFPEHYKMIGITTPRYDDDFVMKRFYELQKREDGYSIQMATWDVHPNLTIADYKNEISRNYRRAMRDFGAQPSGVIESFWPDSDYVENHPCELCKNCPVYHSRETNTNHYCCEEYDECLANAYIGNGEFRNWFTPGSHEYMIHFDLSKNKDRTSFTISHVESYIDMELDGFQIKILEEKGDYVDDTMKYVEKPIIKVDCIGVISPASQRDSQLVKNGEIYYDGILNCIIKKLIDKGFDIVKVTMDSYQSHHFKQTLEDYGLETELISLDRTDEVPVAAKLAITEERVIYPYNYILCDEAKHLKYIKSKKVDHARGGGKDAWDGFAGSIYNCEQSSESSGAFEGLD